MLTLLLAACSEAPKVAEKKAAEPEKPPEPITGLDAVFKLYPMARTWAPDALPLKATSVHNDAVKAEPGKAAAWQVTFVSQATGRQRDYNYSVVEGPGNFHKGAFAGPEDGWSQRPTAPKPIVMAALRKDTVTAYEVATKKGAEYAKKHADKRINYLLEFHTRYPDPTWRVIWGESVGTSGFSVFVDATTGEYLQTMR